MKNSVNEQTTLQRIIIFIFFWFLLQDFILSFLTSNFGLSYTLAKIAYFGSEVFILLIYLHSINLVKNPFIKNLTLCLYLLIMGYSFVGFVNGAQLFDILAHIRRFLVPLICITLGYVYLTQNPSGYSIKQVVKYVLIFFFFASLFGIYEMFYLDPFWWKKYANVGEFYFKVKGFAENYSGIVFGSSVRPEFKLIGAKKRLTSIYAEALAAGYMSANAAILSILALRYVYGKKKLLLYTSIIISILALIRTGTRSAYIYFAIITAFVLFHKRQLRIIIPLLILLYFSYRTKFFMSFISRSIRTMGGLAHKQGIIDFITALDKPSFLVGHGIGIELIKESGYGFILSQMGIMGLSYYLILFAAFGLKIIKGPRDSNKMALAGLVMATLIVMNFHYYAFSYKVYGLQLFFLGMIYALNRQRTSIILETK